jgi:hypothetical protein
MKTLIKTIKKYDVQILMNVIFVSYLMWLLSLAI